MGPPRPLAFQEASLILLTASLCCSFATLDRLPHHQLSETLWYAGAVPAAGSGNGTSTDSTLSMRPQSLGTVTEPLGAVKYLRSRTAPVWPATNRERLWRRVLKRMHTVKARSRNIAQLRNTTQPQSTVQPKNYASRVALWGGAMQLPDPPNSYFTIPFQAIKGRGPCRHASRPIVISVRSFHDFKKRMSYSSTRSVVMHFYSGFPVPHNLVLSKNYSCTFMLAAQGSRPVLSSDWSTEPVLTIYNTHNILMFGIGLHHGVSTSAQSCDFYLFTNKNGREKKHLTCPGLFIAKSYGIQVARAKVYGRIDVFRSMFVKLDSLSVTTAEVYDKDKPYRSTSTFGIIRMGQSSIGAKFVASNNVISNCEVHDGWKLITIYQGAVGVTLRNNNLHHFYMAAIQCGAYDGYSFDCHNNYFGYNLIWNPQGWENSDKTDPDNGGIYTFTHWFNPNNYLTCNYILNQKQCIYLDSASSGVTVDGGLCSRTGVGVKVNNGKYNIIKSLIVTNSTQFMSYVTCVTAQRYIWPAALDVRLWEGVRRKYYNTREINEAYPWMQTLVNPVPSSVRGVNCNPEGGLGPKKTGKCSGLAYENTVQTYAYIPPPNYDTQGYTMTPYWGNCDNIPAMPKLNTQKWFKLSGSEFVNPQRFDFGIRRGSSLLQAGFKSCPRWTIGRRRVSLRAYLYAFNIPKPASFDAMLAFRMPPLVLAQV